MNISQNCFYWKELTDFSRNHDFCLEPFNLQYDIQHYGSKKHIRTLNRSKLSRKCMEIGIPRDLCHELSTWFRGDFDLFVIVPISNACACLLFEKVCFTSAYIPFSDSIPGQESSKLIANGNLILTQWKEFSRECRQFLEFRNFLFLVLSLECLWAWQVCDCLTRIGKKSYQTGVLQLIEYWFFSALLGLFKNSIHC